MKKVFKYILAPVILIGFAGACIEEADSISGVGKNRFRLSSSDEYSVAVIEAATTQYPLIQIWRDVNSEASLKSASSVNLEIDNSLIDAYNLENGTNFVALPTSVYTIEATTLNFGAGVFNYTVKFTPDPSHADWDYSEAYALGVKLAGAPSGYEISAGEDKAVIAVVVKNPYEADYATSGYFFHPSAPRAMADGKYLYTLGPNTSEAGLGDLYGAGYWFAFDVDGSNNLTNWVNLDATPAAPGGSGFMTLDNPGGFDYSVAAAQDGATPGVDPWTKEIYNNTYDPDAQTFWMHYGYRAGGAAGQIVFNRQCYEKWVRK